jgi:hypothetical protein
MRVITGILAVLALLASGCTQAAAPDTLPDAPLPTSAGSLGPTGTPAPTRTGSPAPDSPAALAVAALERYFTSANETARGGSLEAHRATYGETCSACSSATADFDGARSRGLAADGDRYETWRIEVQNVSDSQVVLLSVIDFAAVNLIDPEGVVVEEVPAWTQATFVWTLSEQESGEWLPVQGQLLS